MNNSKEMVRIAYDAIDEKKGTDITILNISEISVISDYFVIATGSNANQVAALVDNVEEKMTKAGYTLRQREGNNNSPWILLDYSDVIVHVFDKEYRAFYHLDHIWNDGVLLNREDMNE